MTVQLFLVNPPAREGYTHERSQSGGVGVSRKRKPFEPEEFEIPPHDFLYQAAVAEQAGHRVELIDLPLERIYDIPRGVSFVRAIVERHLRSGPLWIGVRFSMPTLPSDLQTANALKTAFPQARVFAFGNVIMTTHRHWIGDASFDYVFYGEPEAIIAQALSTPDPASVPGVIDVEQYKLSAPTDPYDIASTADYRKWRKVTDLRALPRAAWHLVELGRYTTTGRTSDVAISVPTSRGCFMPCTMCAYNLLEGRAMRFRSAADTVDELAFLNRTYGIRHFRLRDPNFSGNRAHLQAVAEAIVESGLPLEIAAELSLELLDRPLMELLHRSGIRTILTGVESSDDEIMRSIGQNVRISHILEEKIALAQELGLKVYAFFLIGAPEETWHTVQQTIEFAKSLHVEATMTTMTPFPGTPMYWRALFEFLLDKRMRYEDWNSYTATMPTYQLPLREVERARTWARLETYVPYRWHSGGNRLCVAAHLAPRVAALGAMRTYARFKLWRERRDTRPRPTRVNVVAGRGLIPIPTLSDQGTGPMSP